MTEKETNPKEQSGKEMKSKPDSKKNSFPSSRAVLKNKISSLIKSGAFKFEKSKGKK